MAHGTEQALCVGLQPRFAVLGDIVNQPTPFRVSLYHLKLKTPLLWRYNGILSETLHHYIAGSFSATVGPNDASLQRTSFARPRAGRVGRADGESVLQVLASVVCDEYAQEALQRMGLV